MLRYILCGLITLVLILIVIFYGIEGKNVTKRLEPNAIDSTFVIQNAITLFLDEVKFLTAISIALIGVAWGLILKIIERNEKTHDSVVVLSCVIIAGICSLLSFINFNHNIISIGLNSKIIDLQAPQNIYHFKFMLYFIIYQIIVLSFYLIKRVSSNENTIVFNDINRNGE